MSQKTCPKCNKIMTQKTGKYGKFWACSGYPSCKTTEKFTYEKIESVKVIQADFVPSYQQEKIYTAMRNLTNNILIEAGPGCGKTSTLISGLKYLPKNQSVLFLAFNKTIVTEIESKIPESVMAEVKTLHGLGYSFIRKIYPSSKVDSDKYKDIVKNYGMIAEDDKKSLISPLINIMTKLSANCLNPTNENITTMIENYGIEIECNYDISTIIQYMIEEGIKSISRVSSFDDMITYAAKNPGICKKYDIILIDEAQDLTSENIKLVKNCMAENGKVIFVGDKNQSIYGFRGANIESIADISNAFQPEILPLTVTRRIPQNIVQFLNNDFPEIELTSEKPGGILESIYDTGLLAEITKDDSAMVLCRYNGPLIKPAMELIKKGYKTIIRGKDISNEIINLILTVTKKNNCQTIADLLPALDSHYNQLCEKFINAKNKNFLEVIKDKIDVIFEIAQEAENINDIISKLQQIFDDNLPARFVFSSIHKAKGQESESVYCLYPEKWISKKAVSFEAKQQEINASWVGYTRSKNKMIFVNENKA